MRAISNIVDALAEASVEAKLAEARGESILDADIDVRRGEVFLATNSEHEDGITVVAFWAPTEGR